jgi:PadR family transcriptional regulator, regulatory protein PadR
MPKVDKLQGSLELLVLKVLSRRPNIHGYAISAAIRQVSEDILRVEDGSLYPALHRLEGAGWIRAKWVNKETGGRSRVYELSPEGNKQLMTEESRWRSITIAVDRVLRTV